VNDNVTTLTGTRGDDDPVYTYRIPPGFGRFFRAWLGSGEPWILEVFEDRLCMALETDRYPHGVAFHTAINRLRRCGWNARLEQPCLLVMTYGDATHPAVLECNHESANLTLCQSPERFAEELIAIDRYYSVNKTSRSFTK
jgi:hypothetical protein